MAMRRKRNLTINLPFARPPPPPHLPLRSHPIAPPPTSSHHSIASLDDLEILSTLGSGYGGTVYKVRHRHTSALYALKVIHHPISTDDDDDDDEADRLLRSSIATEMDILARVDSPYVVRCHGIFKKGSDTAFVLEYMDLGTVASLMLRYPTKEKATTGCFSEDIVAAVAKQVLRGLGYLHGLNIVHRDIKPANLLVNSKMEVKIADFGVSEMMKGPGLRRCSSYIGTHAYMSPDRFDPGSHGGSYDGFAADIWSLGITLWELYLGRFPLVAEGEKPDWANLMAAICLDDMPAFPDTATHEFRDFLSSCLCKDSGKRATVSDLLVHPFLTKETSGQVH